ncbi:mucin-5AC-like [Rhopalosiphum maidis]|uniref:mucin-5AC-like n=1 Tax=Rhopalosiphum maidis TaxID=43146 RepID=UPI000EFE9702|nr:mucin-5AC-like [Rhopalosiphum maidis]
MAGLKICIIAVLTLQVAKDGVFSCTLRSHKHGSSHACLPSTSDSTPILNITPDSKPHTISPPCGSSGSPSSCSPSVPANGTAISSTPTLSQDMSSPGSTSLLPPTPSAPSNNTDILNSIIQLLSSPAYSTLQAGKAPTPDKSILPSSSTSNAAQLPAFVSKPHTTSSPCAPGSSSSSSSILPNPSCGPAQSTFSTVPTPQLSNSASTPPSITNTDIINFLLNMSSSVSSPSSSSTSKPMPFSPPCHLLTPTLNKIVVPGTKPCVISHHVTPSLSILPRIPHGSSSLPNHQFHEVLPVPASEKSPALTPASFPEHEPETAPEEFPAASNVPVSIPVVTSTYTPSLISGYNPVLINLLLKLLQSNQAQKVSSSPLIPTKTYDIHAPSVTPVSAPNIKPHTISPACSLSDSTIPCLSNVLHNQSNSSITPLQQIMTSLTPLSVSGISSGYNPEFMKLVIKNLLSNQTSSLTPLSSLLPLIQAKLNTTSTPSPIPTSTFNKPLSKSNPNVFNTSSNNTFDSAPGPADTNQNLSINNQDLTNILIKLLTSSNASKTSLVPCSSLPISYFGSTLNTTSLSPVLCIPSMSDILSQFPSYKPDSKPSFSSIILSPIITPLPNIKSFPERVPNLISTPTSYPIPPSSDINLCRSKNKELLKLSSVTPTGVNPCLQNIIRPHTPHLPLPCSLPHTKLSSGCKHLSPTI